ncbi:TPA: transketolase C-terminal domain-containing protein [Streptococcus agalactiae]
MRCSTKEMRLVYRDFLLQANQENKQITVLEADLSSSMSTNALASEFGKRYINLGIMVSRAIEAADYLKELGIEASVIDLFKIKPLPEELKPLLIDQSIVTIENHNRIGGIGSALCEWLSMEKDTTVSRMGIDERFGQVGQMEYLLEEYGLAVKDIVQHCKSIYKS